MKVRRGLPSDLELLVAGNSRMALETESLTLDPQKIRPGVAAVLEGKVSARYYVGEVGGAVVAQLMITEEWSDWRNASVWWIQSVWVPPEHRRQGYYRELYLEVKEEARKAGAAGIRLYVDARNERAKAVYRALGMNGEHYQVFEAMDA